MHTPGPWSLHEWGDHEIDIHAPDGRVLCSMAQEYNDETGGGMEIEPDAQLIAAAPELLEALRNTKDELIALYERLYPDNESENDTTLVIDQAIATIEKATRK
jgi:hypothetical protein